jgi:hypothetical protein
MIRNLLFYTFIFLILGISVFALSKPQSFINYTTNIIYTDCKGKNITSDNPRFLIGEMIKWPYSEDYLRKGIEIITSYDYKQHNVDNHFLIEEGNEGIGILKCENNHLDIYGTRYYWNGVEIIPSTTIEVSKINQTVNQKIFFKIGDISLSIFGGISLISISAISVAIISIGSFVFILIKKKTISFSKYEITVHKK